MRSSVNFWPFSSGPLTYIICLSMCQDYTCLKTSSVVSQPASNLGDLPALPSLSASTGISHNIRLRYRLSERTVSLPTLSI